MAEYAKKTCYDCGVRFPANTGHRVTESYTSGRSDRRPDGANVAGFLFSDAKTSRKMLKGAFTKNNRRKYTRNRTVWKCKSCAGYEPAGAPEPTPTVKVKVTVEDKRAAFEERKARDARIAQEKLELKALRAEEKAYNETLPLSIASKFFWGIVLFMGVMSVIGMIGAAIDGKLQFNLIGFLMIGAMVYFPIKKFFFREYNRIKRAS